MKNFFVSICLFAALIFVVSCGGGSSKESDNTDTGETVTDEDSDTVDTDQTDTEPTGDTTPENPDTEPAGDTEPSGDTEPADDADSQPDSSDSQPDNDNDSDTTPPDPCDPNPCENLENSNGKCSSKGSTYKCECNENYFWSNSKCAQPQNLPLGKICTGADKCYDNEEKKEIPCPDSGEKFYGQDVQYANLGFCTPKQFANNNNNPDEPIIIDMNTGLEWQENKNGNNYEYTWENAVKYCDELTWGGHDDWRLPTPQELASYKFGDGFPRWTSKKFLGDTVSGADESFILYYQRIMPHENSDSLNALCVRGNELPDAVLTEKSYGTNNTKVVLDSTNELMWSYKETPVGQTRLWKWSEALAYCENLIYAGFNDWRLPNTHEILTLINYDKFEPASDFPEIRGQFLTSSPYVEWGSFSTIKTLVINSISVYDGRVNDNSFYDYIPICVRSDRCDDGYFWNGTECKENKCKADSCNMAHSTGLCIPSETIVECECEDGYFWNGTKCEEQLHVGNICTGQTKCYNNTEEIPCPAAGADFYGQDAQNTSKCAAQSFTPKTLHSNISSDSLNVVFDNNTGLVWEKSPVEENYSWENVKEHCRDLSKKFYAGINNWRLPNMTEFQTIVDLSTPKPSTNANFTNMLETYFWTSTEYLSGENANYPDLVHSFINGGTAALSKTDGIDYKVLCVSGKELTTAEETDFEISSDNKTVTDKRTGLVWQKDPAKDKNWQEALAYCKSLNDSSYAGYNDWRLPDKNELVSLIHSKDSVLPKRNYFWSSSTYNDQPKSAWYVYFTIADISATNKTTVFDAICVRNAE